MYEPLRSLAKPGWPWDNEPLDRQARTNMKNTVAICILLSVLCAPCLSYSKKAELAERTIIAEVLVKHNKLERMADQLFESAQTLREICTSPETIQSTDSSESCTLAAIALHSSSYVFGLVSNLVLCGTLASQKDEPRTYFSIARNGLNNAKYFLKSQRTVADSMYPNIRNKAAL